jgi:hypothetical protein
MTAPSWGRRRLTGWLCLLGALVVLILAASFLAQPFLSARRDLHAGTIYADGYQTFRTTFRTAKIPIVKVRLDDGSTHTVESTPLFKLFRASHSALSVDVQLDPNGAPKRIRYHGKWYGAGPPVWFWIGLGLAFLAAGGLLARGGISRMRYHPAPA